MVLCAVWISCSGHEHSIKTSAYLAAADSVIMIVKTMQKALGHSTYQISFILHPLWCISYLSRHNNNWQCFLTHLIFFSFSFGRVAFEE